MTYTGESGRYYPTLGLAPEPGSTYEIAADPADTRWTAVPVTSPTPKKTTTTTAPADPAPVTEPAPTKGA